MTPTKKQRIEKAAISQEEREGDLQKTSSSVKEFDLYPKRSEKLLESFKLGKGENNFAF